MYKKIKFQYLYKINVKNSNLVKGVNLEGFRV